MCAIRHPSARGRKQDGDFCNNARTMSKELRDLLRPIPVIPVLTIRQISLNNTHEFGIIEQVPKQSVQG